MNLLPILFLRGDFNESESEIFRDGNIGSGNEDSVMLTPFFISCRRCVITSLVLDRLKYFKNKSYQKIAESLTIILLTSHLPNQNCFRIQNDNFFENKTTSEFVEYIITSIFCLART